MSIRRVEEPAGGNGRSHKVVARGHLGNLYKKAMGGSGEESWAARKSIIIRHVTLNVNEVVEGA